MAEVGGAGWLPPCKPGCLLPDQREKQLRSCFVWKSWLPNKETPGAGLARTLSRQNTVSLLQPCKAGCKFPKFSFLFLQLHTLAHGRPSQKAKRPGAALQQPVALQPQSPSPPASLIWESSPVGEGGEKRGGPQIASGLL